MHNTIDVIVATHKEYEFPNESCYLPLYVGKEGKQTDMKVQGDNTGDNISYKNPNYCELTGIYWLWKNRKADYKGIVHYRRYFGLNKNRSHKNWKECIISGEDIVSILSDYDIILPKKRNYYITTVYKHYCKTHYKKDIDITRSIIKEKYPEFIDAFDETMNRKSGFIYNMFIMKSEKYDSYCKWLFDILSELESRIDISQYNDYQRRVYGFIGERLLNVWVEKNHYNYKELPVIYTEKIKYLKKIFNFIRSNITGHKYTSGF